MNYDDVNFRENSVWFSGRNPLTGPGVQGAPPIVKYAGGEPPSPSALLLSNLWFIVVMKSPGCAYPAWSREAAGVFLYAAKSEEASLG